MRGFMPVMIFSALTAGCAAMTVSSHLERNVVFSDYATYDWGPRDALPTGDPRLDNNPFFRDYVEGAIERMLAARGYERATGIAADVLVHYHASVTDRVDVNSVDMSHGYCYANCEPRVIQYREGTLIIDLVDRRTNKVVWRGWAQATMDGVIDDQDRLEQHVDEGVGKMMRLLPRGAVAVPERAR